MITPPTPTHHHPTQTRRANKWHSLFSRGCGSFEVIGQPSPVDERPCRERLLDEFEGLCFAEIEPEEAIDIDGNRFEHRSFERVRCTETD